MTREEFEALLEEAFMMGYEDAISEVFEEDSDFDLESEMDTYTESNKETKARNREIGNKEIEKRFRPVRFMDKKDDEDNQRKHLAMNTNSIFDRNPSLIRRGENGRIKNVRSLMYGKGKEEYDHNMKNNPYIDKTNVMMATNKFLKDIKDPKERKEKINKATEIFKRLQEKRRNK